MILHGNNNNMHNKLAAQAFNYYLQLQFASKKGSMHADLFSKEAVFKEVFFVLCM